MERKPVISTKFLVLGLVVWLVALSILLGISSLFYGAPSLLLRGGVLPIAIALILTALFFFVILFLPRFFGEQKLPNSKIIALSAVVLVHVVSFQIFLDMLLSYANNFIWPDAGASITVRILFLAVAIFLGILLGRKRYLDSRKSPSKSGTLDVEFYDEN